MAFSFLYRLKGGLKRGLKGSLKGGFKVGLKGGAAAGDLEYQVYVPGRLVHVRLHGPKLSADIVGVYQWVLHSRSMDGNAANRSRLWSLLGKLLAALPRRNVLAIAGDLNTPACRLDIHVGSGVLQRRRQQDEEFHQLLRVHDLCLLNTWGSARAGRCATFCNGKICSLIDFVATRRAITDVQARTAKPLNIDLAPWRLGPKHKPILGSVPWIGAWQLRRAPSNASQPYALHALRACSRVDPDKWTHFSQAVRQAVAVHVGTPTVAQLNKLILPVCRRFFPPGARLSLVPLPEPTRLAITQMWAAFRAWKSCRLFGVWKQYSQFRAASKALRQASVQARRKRLHDFIDRAARAAAKDQMNELFQVTRALAPKQRAERVVIRSPDGHMLAPREQFQAILTYFTHAFSVGRFRSSASAPDITRYELEQVIGTLRSRKAVPVGSTPPEVWKACPDIFAASLAATYARSTASSPSCLPSEITDCHLMLLPKPNKVNR